MFDGRRCAVCTLLATIAFAGLPLAQASFDSGSDGSDGALVVASGEHITFNLAEAATAPWDTPSPVPGKGVYDEDQWAIVFKFTTIDIAENGSVTFTNHPKNPPVVFLATGDVNIDGAIRLNGEDGRSTAEPNYHAIAGPGGFGGGLTRNGEIQASGGFGPGGGAQGCGGGYGGMYSNCGRTYGNAEITPLVGGSGGGGGQFGASSQWGGGAGGGGAILIACSGGITLNGSIEALGGNAVGSYAGCGSGGAIRLIANQIDGTGQLRAYGGTYGNKDGGAGRIRVEALEISLTDPGSPSLISSYATGPVFPPAFPPVLRASMVDSQSLPADPDAGIDTVETQISVPGPTTLLIEAENVPVGLDVTVYVVPLRGAALTFTSDTPLAGTFESSTTTATITFPPGRSEIQLKVNWTP